MSISWPLERRRDRHARHSMPRLGVLQLVASEYGILAAVSIALAVVASCISVAAEYLSTLRQGFCSTKWYYSSRVCEEWVDWPFFVGWIPYVLMSMVFAIVPAYLVTFAPGAKMSGIPELRSYFQGFKLSFPFDTRTLVVKIVGIALIGASGLFLGLEAPMTHISAIATGLLLKFLPISEAKRRDLVLASASAGLTVAFSSPLGGVMFSIEAFMPSRSVVWKCFVSSMIAIITLRSIVSPSSSFGGLVLPETGLFRVHFDRVWQAIEIVPFILLGCLGGLYGALVPKLANLAIPHIERRPLVSVLFLSAFTAFFCYLNPISRIPTTDLVSALFEECRPASAESLFCKERNLGGLVYTLLLSGVLAPISFTLPVPSGILFPAIVIGSVGGRIVGLLMQTVLESLPVLATSFCPDAEQHCITPGVYAVVGAACFVTGITRLTISSVILMMEITGALSFVLPVMLAVIVAKWVNDLCGDTCTIYSSWQSSRPVPALPPLGETVPDISAKQFMIPLAECQVIRGSAFEYHNLTNCRYQSVPFLGEADEFHDMILVKSGMSEPYVELSPNSTLNMIISTMSKTGVRVVVLCKNDKFLGLVTRNDILNIIQNPPEPAIMTEYEIDSDFSD